MHGNAGFSRAHPSFFAIVPIRKWRRTSINLRDFGHAKKD
jgi:hypothetical protein